MTKKIVVGKFGKPFGVKGWLKIHSFTHPAENITHFSQLFISNNQSNWKGLTMKDWMQKGENIIALPPSSSSPEEAKTYTNQLIAVDRSQLPTLTADEFYWEDLVGLKVINTKGIELGTVDHLFATPSNDILVVKNGKEHLIPYLNNVILEIDLTAKKITVDWDEDF